MSASAFQNSYDQVPYSANVFSKTMPSRIGAVASLYGLSSAPPDKCRLLELGCGFGMTPLLLAQLFPGSEFVGIDLSKRQIDTARDLADKLGLKNVKFEARSITDISKEKDGLFDYITCHGVFSWVPPEVQEKILEICGTQLTPRGVAYVSYNTYPGWSALGALRQIFLYHAGRFSSPEEKVAQSKTLFSLLKENTAASPWQGQFLADVSKLIETTEDTYFLHEYLEENNRPCWFHEFMARAEPHGLQFLSEATVGASIPASLGPHLSKLLEMIKRSVVDREQYIDFLRNTQFRTSLLVASDRVPNRLLPHSQLARLTFAASASTPDAKVDLNAGKLTEFTYTSGAKFSSADPFQKAVLTELTLINKGSFVSVPDLAARARDLLKRANLEPPQGGDGQLVALTLNLLGQLLISNMVEPGLPEAPVYVADNSVPPKPFCLPLSRAAAAANLPAVRHDYQSVKLAPSMALIVSLCDGKHTQEQIFAAYADAVQKGAVEPPAPAAGEKKTDLAKAFGRLLNELKTQKMFWKPAVADAVAVSAPAPVAPRQAKS